MTDSESDLEALNRLQQQAKEGRSEVRKPRTRTKRATKSRSGSTVKSGSATQASVQQPVEKEKMVVSDDTVQDLVGQIESLVKEMEEAAIDRPVLSLLAAFSVGVIVSQLFCRR